MKRIQKKLGVGVSAFGLALLSSCGGGTPPAVEVQEQQGPAWILKFSAICNKVPQEQCVAGFGFTVDAQGKYSVGPGPAGESVSGSVSKEYFELLAKQLQSALSSRPQISEEQCLPREESLLSKALVELRTGAGEPKTLVRLSASESCHSQIDADAAKQLLEKLQKVALNYYPLPFPDDNCDSARGRLENLYAEARQCKDPSDCAYVEESFEVVPEAAVKIIATGDCSGVPGLVIGNREWVQKRSPELAGALKATQQACKKRQVTGVCSGISEFKVTQPLPKCVSGSCRAG